MTRYSPLDIEVDVNRIVSEEAFQQLLDLVIPDHDHEVARKWWAQQLIEEGKLTDMEIVMLSQFIKNQSYITIKDDIMTWSSFRIMVDVVPKAIESLIQRELIRRSGDGRYIRTIANAALYCCPNCWHTGLDRFNMQCVQCGGLGVVRNPRKVRK